MADTVSEAKELWQEADDFYREEHQRMLEDLEFSNPADPKQWTEADKKAREENKRPCLTLDQTNQVIDQVANDARQNRRGVDITPTDTQGSKRTAEVMEGMVRQVEYENRAYIAYNTALDFAARMGKGYFRIGTRMLNPAMNWQKITVSAIVSPLSVRFDTGSVELDGMDGKWCFNAYDMHRRQFKKKYGDKTAHTSWTDTVGRDNFITLCEYFYVDEVAEKYLHVVQSDGVERQILAADWEAEAGSAQQRGLGLQPGRDFEVMQAQTRYCLYSGSEKLEEDRDFPSQYIPIVPVYGHVLWIKNKRYVCGLSRRMRESQRLRNFERSAWVEVAGQQPKVPWIVPVEGIAGHEDKWKNANRSSDSALVYNAFTADGQAIPPPQRSAPPNGAQVFAAGVNMATDDLQASVGYYRSNYGAPSNAVSGKAKLADQREGDTATFHYQDNLSIAIEHGGRIMVDMIPRVMDSKREVTVRSIAGAAEDVVVDPDAGEAFQQGANGSKVVNFNKGGYAVHVKTGPAYHTLRQEASTAMTELLSRNPALMQILGPWWLRMQDWPGADHAAELLMAVAPKPIQDLENKNTKIPAEVRPIIAGMEQQIEAAAQQIQEMGQALQQAQMQLQDKQADAQAKMMDADTKAGEAQVNAQVKVAELALRERDMGLREREMVLRELQAAQQADQAAQSGNDTDNGLEVALKASIDDQKLEIDRYNAETKRMQVEQDGEIAARKADQEAAALALAADKDEQDRVTQGAGPAGEAQSSAQPAAALDSGMAAALLVALQTLQQTVDSLTASKNKVARMTKVGDGTWQMESVETPAEQPGADELEGDEA
jgi:hypothetical protein